MLLMRNEWLGVDCAHGRYSIMRIPRSKYSLSQHNTLTPKRERTLYITTTMVLAVIDG